MNPDDLLRDICRTVLNCLDNDPGETRWIEALEMFNAKLSVVLLEAKRSGLRHALWQEVR